MSNVKYDYDYHMSCPVCGEKEHYDYYPGNQEDPSPAEASCNTCGWWYVETAEHYPRITGINKYRRQIISRTKKFVKQLESRAS